MFKKNHFAFSVFLLTQIILFSACNTGQYGIHLPSPQTHTGQIPAATQPQSQTVQPATSTPELTSQPVPIKPTIATPTLEPYMDLSIQALQKRTYGGGVLQSEGLLDENPAFKRYQFKYRSDGLDLYGFLDEPVGAGPFPVIIMLHGAVDQQTYQTKTYTVRYADALAESGFIVLNPNLRGYPPSEDKDNDFGIGDTIDVLNLIALIRTQAGSVGILQKADQNKIGLWGHSMGAGIVLRVLVIDLKIAAAVLYGSLNADERLNMAHFGNDGRRDKKIIVSSASLEAISPANYLEDINTPISIHHGAADTIVPVQWSRDLCQRLQTLGKQVECYLYPDQPHTFQNSGDTLFIERVSTFFKKYMQS